MKTHAKTLRECKKTNLAIFAALLRKKTANGREFGRKFHANTLKRKGENFNLAIFAVWREIFLFVATIRRARREAK